MPFEHDVKAESGLNKTNIAGPDEERNAFVRESLDKIAMPVIVMNSDTQQAALDHYVWVVSMHGVDRQKCVCGSTRSEMQHRVHLLPKFPNTGDILSCAALLADFEGITLPQLADLWSGADVRDPESALCALEDGLAIIKHHSERGRHE